MPFQPPPHTAWQALFKQYPALENILSAVVGNNPAEQAMDMVGPMAPAMGMARKGSNVLGGLMQKIQDANLEKTRQAAGTLQNYNAKRRILSPEKVDHTRPSVGDKLGAMREKMLTGPQKFNIDKNVSQALRIEDNLGFDTPQQAASAILSNPDWATRWDINPDFHSIIERWRKGALLERRQ